MLKIVIYPVTIVIVKILCWVAYIYVELQTYHANAICDICDKYDNYDCQNLMLSGLYICGTLKANNIFDKCDKNVKILCWVAYMYVELLS